MREPSSYRDPDGYVARIGEDICRVVLNDNAPIVLPVYKKFFDACLKEGLLVPFEKTPAQGNVFRLEKLPLVSYPYEWGFEQLKEGALVTLDIGLKALEHGLSLKDAVAFNVQPYNGRMVFIDHTSFEPTDGKLPWRAYSQFCRHFLAPLLITSKTGANANRQFLVDLNGIVLGDAVRRLPFITRFSPSAFTHIYLHNMLTNSLQDTGKEQKAKPVRTGSQKAYLQHLRKVVENIKPPKYGTEWYNYYNNTNYNDASFDEKEKFIHEVVTSKRYHCVWDMGGNNGHFSRIMAKDADIVISMDIDYAAVDLNWVKNRQTKTTNIYPIVMDLTNPSPAVGFGNAERGTIDDRSQPDLMFALALIHHLAVTYNLPFEVMAKRFRENGAELVIEFVDREDSQFKKLLRSKDIDYAHYTKSNFEKAFGEQFALVRKAEIKGTERTLYHYAPKK